MRLIALAALAACGGPSTPPVQPPPAPAIEPSIAQPIAQPVAPPRSSRIVVVTEHLSSREPANARALRHILAVRKGRVELGLGFGQLGLSVTKVVSGTLDDPDYAARPIGVNTLPVILLDEAAFAAADLPSLEGFEGTWKLTRMADGALVVDAISDTPFSASKVANRFAVREQARQDLHGSSPEQRFAGIEALGHHAFYELVPDLIALLDDTAVGPSAAHMLRQLAEPLADPATPQTPSRRDWELYWHDLLASRPVPPAVVGTTIELATVEMNQSSPDLVAIGAGFAMGMTRLERQQLDGHVAGIATMTAPWQQRTWLTSATQDGLDAAVAPDGAGILSSDDGMDALWHFAVGGTDRIVIDPKERATHAAVAAGDHGFVIVYIKEKVPALFALALDAAGKPRGAAVKLALPSRPAARFHRGVHPVALARRSGGGWLALVETDAGVIAERFDDALAAPQTTLLATEPPIVEPRVVDSFAVWKHRNQLASLVVADAGAMRGEAAPPLLTGADVWLAGKPVALDDGYAVAWIEADGEVHLGRFDAGGARIANVVVHARGAMRFSLALAREGSALLVAFEDETRYPFHIVARRVELAALK